MPLPIPAEIGARLAAHREADDPRDLFAIRHAAIIFALRRLLRVAKQISAGNVVMVADLGAADAAEKFLSPIRADT
jgi:hypothetical protein